MGLETVINAKNAALVGGMLSPILVIGGLIVMWVAIVLICLNFGLG